MYFHFKEFSIKQEDNPQKVGTDSMLLGAWVSGNYNRVLDIGTGTGILALMMAQKFPRASITAIEPDQVSCIEANENFANSPFRNRIMGIQVALQNFGAMEKFDLIISNPPYFENSFLSADENRNRARHTADLPLYDLYENTAELLSESGRFYVVAPFEMETKHIERAFDHDLFVQQILHTLTPMGQRKRSLIAFGFEEVDPKLETLIVKNEKNEYSEAYISMTKAFYGVDLSLR